VWFRIYLRTDRQTHTHAHTDAFITVLRNRSRGRSQNRPDVAVVVNPSPDRQAAELSAARSTIQHNERQCQLGRSRCTEQRAYTESYETSTAATPSLTGRSVLPLVDVLCVLFSQLQRRKLSCKNDILPMSSCVDIDGKSRGPVSVEGSTAGPWAQL